MSRGPRLWADRVAASRKEGLLALEFFVVFSQPTSGKEAVRRHLAEHLEFQRGIEASGRMFAAGPLSDPAGRDWTGDGMIILRTESLEEAHEIAAADPMHTSGARSYTIRPWLMNEASFTIHVRGSEHRVELE